MQRVKYFRDAFVADIFTSLVRPLQDIVYCLFYYCVSIWAMFSSSHSLDDVGIYLKNSWVLHNIALPACAILPLWFKFLQTLRQARDSGRHWPHTANSFKYLTAACVIFYAMAHPEGRRGRLWITSFVAAVLYQIWWDVVMDWELLVIVPRRGGGVASPPASLAPSCLQPIVCRVSKMCHYVACHRIALRPQRLYRRNAFYWRVLTYNVCFRFIWMLSFVPAYHFSSATGEEISTLSIDFKTYVGAVISVAELIRRCLWGILKLELETIQVSSVDEYGPLTDMDEKFGQTDPLHLMVSALQFESQALMLGTPGQDKRGRSSCSSLFTCSEAFWRRVFALELVIWAAAFIGLGSLSVLI